MRGFWPAHVRCEHPAVNGGTSCETPMNSVPQAATRRHAPHEDEGAVPAPLPHRGPSTMLRRSLVPASLLILLAVVLPVAAEPSPAPPPVRLAVLVVFDQLRADYLTRWDGLFGDGGFHRLEKDGAWFRNCRYPYAGNVTGAGHSSLATGRSPCKHGIFNNEWYDRDLGDVVYCAATPERKRVPPPAGRGRHGQEGKEEVRRHAGAADRANAGRRLPGCDRRQGTRRVAVVQGSRRGVPRRPQTGRLLLARREHGRGGNVYLLPRSCGRLGRGVQQGEVGRPLFRQGLDAPCA